MRKRFSQGIFAVIGSIVFIAALGWVALPSTKAEPDTRDTSIDTELSLVSFETLAKELSATQSDTVLVYLWCEYSIPDKRSLQQIASTIQPFQRHGLEIATVCIAQTEHDGPDAIALNRKDIVRELEKANAHFRNYMLHPTDFPQEFNALTTRWQCGSPPIFLLFERSGKPGNRLERTAEYDIIGDLQAALRKRYQTP